MTDTLLVAAAGERGCVGGLFWVSCFDEVGFCEFRVEAGRAEIALAALHFVEL